MNAREEWRQACRNGIGGADIAAILGVSSHRTAMDIFLEQRGETVPVGNVQVLCWGAVRADEVAREHQRCIGRMPLHITQHPAGHADVAGQAPKLGNDSAKAIPREAAQC